MNIDNWISDQLHEICGFSDPLIIDYVKSIGNFKY